MPSAGNNGDWTGDVARGSNGTSMGNARNGIPLMDAAAGMTMKSDESNLLNLLLARVHGGVSGGGGGDVHKGGGGAGVYGGKYDLCEGLRKRDCDV